MAYLFALLAITQGCFCIGLTVFIFIYYVPNKMNQIRDPFRWNVMFVSLSYMLLMIATIRTAGYRFYPWGDTWYWFVSIAYLFGDISLVFVFKSAVKEKRAKQLAEEKEKSNKNNS